MKISGCPALKVLNCNYNQLTQLDLNTHTGLTNLACDFMIESADNVYTFNFTKFKAAYNLNCEIDDSYNLMIHAQDTLITPYIFDVRETSSGEYILRFSIPNKRSLSYIAFRTRGAQTMEVLVYPPYSSSGTEQPTGTAPEITTSSLPHAATGQDYSHQLTASGSTPLTWTIRGKLPDGLTLSPSGLISGTPTKKGKKSFTLTASNDYGHDSKRFTLTVQAPPAITTDSLKPAAVGKRYSASFRGKGTSPLTWTLDGELPNGLTFNSKTAKLSGTPTQNGTFSFTLTLTNPAGSVSATYTLTVSATLPKISPSSIKKGTYGKSYRMAFTAKGTAPITWDLDGELPEGLSFSDGIITGTSLETCTDREITIIASNMAGSTEKLYTLTIRGITPKIRTYSLAQGIIDTEYTLALEAIGSPEIVWSASGLPDGLSLTEDGTISGTPTEEGRFRVRVTAENSEGIAAKNYTLDVLAPPVLSTEGTITAGTLGRSYTYRLQAEGSKPIVYTIADGSLPTGLTLNARNGTLRGWPREAGTYTFTVRAENDAGTDEAEITITIDATEDNSGLPAYGESEGESVIVAVLPEVSADVSGMHDFSVTLSPDVEAGAKLVWIAGSSEPSEDDQIAEFADSDGKEIEAVPEDRRITVSAWLNAGITYRPAIAVKR